MKGESIATDGAGLSGAKALLKFRCRPQQQLLNCCDG